MSEVIIIHNIENYTREIVNGTLKLTPKKQYLSKNELYKIQLAHSIILECVIKQGDRIISTSKAYRSILIDIWKNIPTQKILQKTTFNFKLTKEVGEKGYRWCEVIKMSFQNKDSKGTLKEIIKMVEENDLNIELSIKLETGRIVHFKIQ